MEWWMWRVSVVFQSTLPLRGATRRSSRSRRGSSHFNPRSPCGERPRSHTWNDQDDRFQSTLPLRGATGTLAPSASWSGYFNPRSPCGERPSCSPRTASPTNFNPRSPCGERPSWTTLTLLPEPISIHAPLAGSDPVAWNPANWWW